MNTILRYLYNVLFMALMPVIFLRLFWRSFRAPDYRSRLLERLGFYSHSYKKEGICLHAVSVGELMAARPLILKIKEHYPHLALTITSTTPTGSKQVQQIYGDTVQHMYLPYDYPGAVKRFLKAIAPKKMIVMETEIWPNLFYYLKQQHIPLFIVNARMAEKSFHGYNKARFFFKGVMQNITCIAAQSEMDADHFRKLGASDAQIMIMGNLKYDVVVPQELVNKAKAARLEIPQTQIWIASSTHEAEEALILNTAIEIKKQLPNTLCMIAPRHPERFNALAEKCMAMGLQIARRSQQQTVQADTNILLADTLGELYYFYAMADVAIVCGSFAPIGGHNVLEPASLGLPIMVGPNMFHFKAVLEDFLQKDALLQVDQNTLSASLLDLLTDKSKAQAMGARAKDLVLENQGSIDKLWQRLGHVDICH